MKKISCLAITLAMIIVLSSCNDISSTPTGIVDTTELPSPSSSDNRAPQIDDDSGVVNPYLSIVGRRINPSYEENVWDEVYYTYDLVTQQLREVCVLPHYSGYTAGVVSLWDNAVYFSCRENIDSNANDQIFKYDIQSGELVAVENENVSYNDFTLIDANTLLLIASTFEHTITPAIFNLQSGLFTYMSDANGEDIELYTSGGQLLSYNYLFKGFPWLYFKLTDRYSDGYTNHENAIDYNFIMVSENLRKTDKTFTTQFMADTQVGFLTQISNNVVLAKLNETIFDESIPGFVVKDTYYLLTFDDNHSSFVQIDNPFPAASEITQALTFDGGRTYYCIGYYSVNDTKYSESLFIYDCETDEITPIILTGDDILSIANFRSVG